MNCHYVSPNMFHNKQSWHCRLFAFSSKQGWFFPTSLPCSYTYPENELALDLMKMYFNLHARISHLVEVFPVTIAPFLPIKCVTFRDLVICPTILYVQVQLLSLPASLCSRIEGRTLVSIPFCTDPAAITTHNRMSFLLHSFYHIRLTQKSHCVSDAVLLIDADTRVT